MTIPAHVETGPLAFHGTTAALGGAAALAMAGLVFLLSERRWRERWSIVPVERAKVARGPYRSMAVAAGNLLCAPGLVRLTAVAALVFAQVFFPALLLALTVMPFDGIAIALVPAVLVTLAMWTCGLLLLRRSPSATWSVRSTAFASLLSNCGLFALCAVHVGFVEVDPNYGIREASNSAPAVAFLFAIASSAVAGLLLYTIREHKRALEWETPGAPVTP